MRSRQRQPWGRIRAAWPYGLLLATIVLPSLGVLWMMREAMQNEQLALRQRLTDAYGAALQTAADRLTSSWEDGLQRVGASVDGNHAAASFRRAVDLGEFDSVIVLDGEGTAAYPHRLPATDLPHGERDPAWEDAHRAEFRDRQPHDAAQRYAAIAASTADPVVRARSLQAAARNWIRAQNPAAAIAALQELAETEDSSASAGRDVRIDADLRLLELLPVRSPAWLATANRLTARLNLYSDPSMNSHQRRFAMKTLGAYPGQTNRFPTLPAEVLAAEYLTLAVALPVPSRLTRHDKSDLWAILLPSQNGIGIVRTHTIVRLAERIAMQQRMPQGAAVVVVPPGDATARAVASVPLEILGPGWRLAMNSDETSRASATPFAGNRRYLLVSAALVGATFLLAASLARSITRERRVSRMKNDLVATVSHELKTPVTSIRLLIDSLLDADACASGSSATAAQPEPLDPRCAREYLELIAGQTTRLSRVIDNFLTFSKMEHGKQHYSFVPMDARDAIRQALEVMHDRIAGFSDVVTCNLPSALPIHGDLENLTTALINLLENAWKYSDAPRQIDVSGDFQNGWVRITVGDQGIGLPPHANRHILERFFQVDQGLNRTRGGCGLGLSIVCHIAQAHGGRVSVDSAPEQGSRFSLLLPAVSGEGMVHGV